MREFYLVVTRIGIFCDVGDDSVMPWYVVLLDHPSANIRYTNQLVYMTPPRDEDLRILNQHLPGGATVYCIPEMLEPFLRSLLLTTQRFWCAKPWLKLRINHCFYIDDGTNSGFHFAQIYGKYGIIPC